MRLFLHGIDVDNKVVKEVFFFFNYMKNALSKVINTQKQTILKEISDFFF